MTSMIRLMPNRAAHGARAALAIALAAASGLAAAAAQGAPASTPTAEQRQIDALTQQLQAVQSALETLTEQNRALLQRQLELERRMAASS